MVMPGGAGHPRLDGDVALHDQVADTREEAGVTAVDAFEIITL
jgi:hypothetical protein